MAEVKITENINKNLNILLRKLNDPSRALKQIGQLEVSETQLRFRNQKDPSGRPWKKSERAKKQGGKTLIDTGRLRSSITFATSKTDVFIGTNVVYADIHQFGSDEKNIPQRAFLGVNKKTQNNVRSVLKKFLDL
jgi:phage virion morphogenesis protein